MAKYQFKGLEAYAEYLGKIGSNTKEICGKGVYEMAKIVGDEVKRRLEALPAVNDVENLIAWKEKTKSRLSVSQKRGLIKGFGISTMQNDNGYWNVKLGFDGYNDIQTRKYPRGQPNVLIARICESGSSSMDKTPFIRPAVRATEKLAIERCQAVIDEAIEQINDTNRA